MRTHWSHCRDCDASLTKDEYMSGERCRPCVRRMEQASCPACTRALERVRYPGGALNRDQWESVRAGDWWCGWCPDNGRGNSGAYFWESEIGRAQHPGTTTSDPVQPGIVPLQVVVSGPGLLAFDAGLEPCAPPETFGDPSAGGTVPRKEE